jgi:membrane protease YdiL (CAAX protease family)
MATLDPGESSQQPARWITWLGLFLSLFGMLLIRQMIRSFFGDARSVQAVLVREIAHFALGGSILLLVRFGERRPLSSIGIGTSKLWKSLAWGLVTMLACLVVGGAIAAVTHFNGGAAGKAFAALPIWLVTLTVVRAGIVEEICYRGYSMERLHEVGLSKTGAFLLPLVIFGVGHWTGGWANIVIALALGAILAGFYQWRRDLPANMLAHFLVDFLPNVLPRLLR